MSLGKLLYIVRAAKMHSKRCQYRVRTDLRSTDDSEELPIEMALSSKRNSWWGGTVHNTMCIDADRQAWDAYFRAHPAARHLRGRMFPYFAKACVIFGNDYSYHTLNVCESFGPVVADTPLTASVLGDTQVESIESVGELGEPSSVVDTTPSPLSVEYSFPSVEYSWQ
ncbi:hypothetical protein IFM89_035410 [Coptis chinensis]|uniref:Uncharacterized protein n=1 Tax=Coptis chinensis TaxID=261450 RepID=A0A835HG64_9MAGN|nr:hypothetical protein IFM89_035410 [Coptis chinensis]